MASQQHIKQAIERVTTVFQARPAQAQVTKSTVCEIADGLKCIVRAGDFTFVADTDTTLGGENAGPSAGTYARGALGACLAIGYAMMFAKHNLSVDSVKVEVEADVDLRGSLGLDDVWPGFQKLRYIVDVDTNADAAAIRAALDEADANSPVLKSFAEPVPVERQIRISQSDAATE